MVDTLKGQSPQNDPAQKDPFGDWPDEKDLDKPKSPQGGGLGVIILVVALLLGLAGVGYYLFKTSFETPEPLPPSPPSQPVTSAPPSSPPVAIDAPSPAESEVPPTPAAEQPKGLFFTPNESLDNQSEAGVSGQDDNLTAENLTGNQSTDNLTTDNQLIDNLSSNDNLSDNLTDNLSETQALGLDNQSQETDLATEPQTGDNASSAGANWPLVVEDAGSSPPEDKEKPVLTDNATLAANELPVAGSSSVEPAPEANANLTGFAATEQPLALVDSSEIPPEESLEEPKEESARPLESPALDSQSVDSPLPLKIDETASKDSLTALSPPVDEPVAPTKVEPSPEPTVSPAETSKPLPSESEKAQTPKPTETTPKPVETPKPNDSGLALTPAPKPLEIGSEPQKSPDSPAPTETAPAEPTSPSSDSDDEAIAPVWVSNLHSTPDESESEQVWQKLKSLPGSERLYRYETTVGGIKQRRIRLGFFQTRDEALEASQRLAKEAKLGQPWLVQPTKAEHNKYYGQSLSERWAINISSTIKKEDSEKYWQALEGDKAKKQLKKLERQGQSAPRLYRSEATVNGQLNYRIRLGFFATQKEAEAAAQALVTAAGLTAAQIDKPWAVRPTVDEEKANSQ
ncbi:MAG: SPOR domain-containing protein [Deltaproteobacteria bacterium]|jgi:hypothetical protein|nr:SPOR domain-containing protein [Deltaproteobacteria bacterium]